SARGPCRRSDWPRCAGANELHGRLHIARNPFWFLNNLTLIHSPPNEELQSRIWPEENFGDFDHAVNVAVGKLRTALGDSADDPYFIETVPRRGYRFIAPLDSAVVNGYPAPPPTSGAHLVSDNAHGPNRGILGTLA